MACAVFGSPLYAQAARQKAHVTAREVPSSGNLPKFPALPMLGIAEAYIAPSPNFSPLLKIGARP